MNVNLYTAIQQRKYNPKWINSGYLWKEWKFGGGGVEILKEYFYLFFYINLSLPIRLKIGLKTTEKGKKASK